MRRRSQGSGPLLEKLARSNMKYWQVRPPQSKKNLFILVMPRNARSNRFEHCVAD